MLDEGKSGYGMGPISDLIGHDLVWVESGTRSWPNSLELGTEHELHVGNDIVARMRFQGGMPSEAELSDCHWTFESVKQSRLFGPLLMVRDEALKDVGFFQPRGWKGARFEFRDGRELRLVGWLAPFWPNDWSWQDGAVELVRFKESWSGRKFKVNLVSATAESTELPLLVVMAWYWMLRNWETQRSSP